MIFTWVDYVPSKYADYAYPPWADALGWCMSMTSVAAIPFVIIVQIIRHRSQYSSLFEVGLRHFDFESFLEFLFSADD
jgi:hypothetical protein